MTRGERIRAAIQRHDPATLRRMADEAPNQEDRVFLDLLAEFVDRWPGASARNNDVIPASS